MAYASSFTLCLPQTAKTNNIGVCLLHEKTPNWVKKQNTLLEFVGLSISNFLLKTFLFYLI